MPFSLCVYELLVTFEVVANSMKSLSVPHHPTNEALLKCLSCRQLPAPLRSLPASLCAFCLLPNNFSWTHPALWNFQADFMQLFSGETQYFLCPVGRHKP